MKIDLEGLCKLLRQKTTEDTVDRSGINPYLLDEVLQPILAGKELCYGDIDYSRFEADDLRVLSDYCDRRNGVAYKLEGLIGNLMTVPPATCAGRAFC